jgi:hypothetical protein
LHRVAVVQAKIRVVDGDRAASDLDLTIAAIGSGDDAVHQDSVVHEKVSRFARLPQHRQPEIPVEQERFNRAQTRCSVSPYGRNKKDTRFYEPLARSRGQSRCIALQVCPSHERMVAG